MNKRKRKKAYKKCFYQLVDKINLTTMNIEEIKRIFEDFEKHIKHYGYFHHKDEYKLKNKLIYHPVFYTYPINEINNIYESYFIQSRKHNYKPLMVIQSIDDLMIKEDTIKLCKENGYEVKLINIKESIDKGYRLDPFLIATDNT